MGFARFISRLGYDDAGRVWSIICPQQGFGSAFGDMNVEVSVTGVRGWTDEPNRLTGSEMTVTGKVWFTANNREDGSALFRFILGFLASQTELPFTKDRAIQVRTSSPDDDEQAFFTVLPGLDPSYPVPYFKTRWDYGIYETVWLRPQIRNVIHQDGQSQL